MARSQATSNDPIFAVLIGVLVGWAIITLPFRFWWHEPFLQIIHDGHWQVAILALAFFYAALYSVVYVRSLRRDFDAYIKPRTVTRNQAERIKRILRAGTPHKITVKADPHDREAFEYGVQLRNAISAGGWEVELITSKDPPHPSDALSMHEDGFQKRTKEDDERRNVWKKAMDKAKVEIPGMSASNGDEPYKLYLVVGRRPIDIRPKTPRVIWIGPWQLRRFY